MEEMKKVHIEIDIEDTAPFLESSFENLHCHIKVTGDLSPAWFGLAIMYLCKSYEKELRKRKALEVTDIER